MAFKSALEVYVEGMLRTHSIQSLPKKFVQKAKVIIHNKYDSPCCTDSDAEIDLITNQNSQFVNTIERFLNLMTKQGNIKSLQRTEDLLQKRLDCSC